MTKKTSSAFGTSVFGEDCIAVVFRTLPSLKL